MNDNEGSVWKTAGQVPSGKQPDRFRLENSRTGSVWKIVGQVVGLSDCLIVKLYHSLIVGFSIHHLRWFTRSDRKFGFSILHIWWFTRSDESLASRFTTFSGSLEVMGSAAQTISLWRYNKDCRNAGIVELGIIWLSEERFSLCTSGIWSVGFWNLGV